MPENNMTPPPHKNEVKRQWRVGTFSMGTMLIVFGLLLLLAQFKEFSAVEIVTTWWPGVMVILGLEILAALYFGKEDKPVIKYDVLSVFMVLLIGCISFSLYALTSVGILSALGETVSSQEHTVEVPEQRFVLQPGIKNIVVNASGGNSNIESLYVQEGDANEVVAFAQVSIPAQSQEAAQALVPDNLVNTHTVGDTLFLDFKSVSGGNHFQQTPHVSHTLILPRSSSVQLEDDGCFPLKLKVNDLSNNWVVNGSGTVAVTLSRNANVKVEAFARRLGGESTWISVAKNENTGGQVSLIKAPDGNWIFDENEESRGKAAITFGKGTYELKINADEVFVNEL